VCGMGWGVVTAGTSRVYLEKALGGASIKALTIEELFQGTRPQIPLIDPVSFRRARREDTTPQGILL
jgi:hypothetical protein